MCVTRLLMKEVSSSTATVIAKSWAQRTVVPEDGLQDGKGLEYNSQFGLYLRWKALVAVHNVSTNQVLLDIFVGDFFGRTHKNWYCVLVQMSIPEFVRLIQQDFVVFDPP